MGARGTLHNKLAFACPLVSAPRSQCDLLCLLAPCFAAPPALGTRRQAAPARRRDRQRRAAPSQGGSRGVARQAPGVACARRFALLGGVSQQDTMPTWEHAHASCLGGVAGGPRSALRLAGRDALRPRATRGGRWRRAALQAPCLHKTLCEVCRVAGVCAKTAVLSGRRGAATEVNAVLLRLGAVAHGVGERGGQGGEA